MILPAREGGRRPAGRSGGGATVLRGLVAALLWLVALVALPAHAQEFPKLTGRVVDAAGLLSPAQVQQLEQLSAEVEQASTRQLVVATIPDLQGYPIEEYGYRLGRAWKIGQEEANNGILLIVAPKERRVRIEVGYGLEPIMTDALSGRIIREAILPRFKEGDMPGGILAGAQAIAEQMKLPLEAAEARAKAEADKAAQQPRRSSKASGVPIGLMFWGVVLIAIVIPMMIGGARGRRRRYRGGSDGSMLPILLWTIADEVARNSHRGGWGGGSGGGWGGGDWGGGGGGGGFSGGGGSFGGGGASGSW